MARMPFFTGFPGFRGALPAPLPDGNAAGCRAPTCALPIGARLYLLSKSFGKAILAGIVGAAKPLLLGEVPEQSRRADPSSNGGESRNPAKPVKKNGKGFFYETFVKKRVCSKKRRKFPP